MLFKEKLKELREERGLTQKNIALACDLTPTCICQLETGARNPTGSTLVALANFFDVSIDYLMGLTENEDSFSNAIPERANKKIPQGAPMGLKNDEQELLRMYRSIDGELQRRALAYMRKLFDVGGDERALQSPKKA